MTNELKKCPFCGNEPLLNQTAINEFDVCCWHCNIGTFDIKASKENVIKRWNRRVRK